MMSLHYLVYTYVDRENVSASEHAYYQWIVRTTGDQSENISCEFVTKSAGVDGYMRKLEDIYMFAPPHTRCAFVLCALCLQLYMRKHKQFPSDTQQIKFQNFTTLIIVDLP